MRHAFALGLLGFGATASAFTFDDVLFPTTIGSGSETFVDAFEVVVFNGRQVGVIGAIDPDSDPDNFNNLPAVLFSKPIAGNLGPGQTQVVVKGLENLWDDTDAGGDFDASNPQISNDDVTFTDLAITSSTNGTRLTFVTQLVGDDQYAILQYDPDASNTSGTKHRVVAEGDKMANGVGPAGLVVDSLRPSVQVNADGTALFAGTFGGSPTVATRNGTGAATVLDAETLDIANFPWKRAITPSGDGVVIADNGALTSIFDVTAGSYTMRVASFSDGLAPTAILGVNETHTLFVTTDSVTDYVILHDGSNSVTYGSYPHDPVNGLAAQGQLTAGGKAAFFLTDSDSGDIFESVVYINNGIATTVASLGTAVGGGYTIAQISIIGSSSPMLNDNGYLVFDAQLDDGLGNLVDAFLLSVNGSAPQIIIKADDIVTIDGADATIFGLLPNDTQSGSRGDIFKDGLSEDNHFGFIAFYEGGTAVLLTDLSQSLVPEPAGVMVLAMGAMGVLARRRRR
jgi:hypothetical protein